MIKWYVAKKDLKKNILIAAPENHSILFRKRIWHAGERYNNLQDALGEISIALKVAEKQAPQPCSCG